MRRPLSTAAALAAGLALMAGPALAGTMTVPVDHTVKLALAGPAGSVVVGNPTVADVTVVDSRTVFVTGKGPGSTDVNVIDPLGRNVFSGDVRVVGEAGSHVVVHHGPTQRADLSCDPGCVPSTANAASAARSGGYTGSGSGVTPASVMSGALMGAIGGAAGGAAAAFSPRKPS